VVGIAPTARLFGDVQIAPDALVCDYTVIGHPREARALDESKPTIGPTTIGAKASVFPFAIIYEGSSIGDRTIIEERCKVGYGVTIGTDCHVINGAIVHDRATVGNHTIVGGIVCERALVGSHVTVMGVLLHPHTSPEKPWGEVEPAPVIHDRVVIAMGAAVIGDVEIANNVYVAANAVVTRSVPSHHVVTGRNKFTPAEHWRGRGIGDSFWDWST
jgi:acetyltransferase-like isoleucine patch superfamily enzyme